MKVQGTCHCKKIAYEAEIDPGKVQLCNCADCQMLSGSAYRVSVQAPKDSFRLLSGAPKAYIKTADSGTKRSHSFCADCGTPVYSCAVTDPQAYSLRVGCLEQRADLAPKRRIWGRSALPWAENVAAVPLIDHQ
jgi:hypothetical protein